MKLGFLTACLPGETFSVQARSHSATVAAMSAATLLSIAALALKGTEESEPKRAKCNGSSAQQVIDKSSESITTKEKQDAIP